MIRRLILSLILLFNYSVPAANDTEINSLISEFSSKTRCGSVSVVVYDHGEFSYYGDNKGLYQIGSMTKAFTGLAVQQLIDEGIVSESDSVSDFIPGFTAYCGTAQADITIEDLLTQRSGFTNNENDYPPATEDMSLTDWAQSISGKELKSKPGTEYAYSNVNYNLLGLIIENVTGRPYKDYMENEVFLPLELESTSAGVPENEDDIVKGSRLGFRSDFEYDVPVREASVPAGYFYSDTEDTGKWMKAWIECEDPAMETVLSRLEKPGDYYAGWERTDDDTIGHSGGTPNYSSRIVFSVSEGTGVCVLTNLNVASTTDSLCNSIFAIVTGKGQGRLICDVWTVFDIIFTSVSVIGALYIVIAVRIRKKGALTAAGSVLGLLTVLILILFPLIFGAGIKAIALTWAPWSFLAGIVIMAAGVAVTWIRLFVVKVNEGRAKTG
jgi:CubicO group peptidase (beta-lactamase class C family)